jgi:predicted ribonuclease YlaK
MIVVEELDSFNDLRVKTTLKYWTENCDKNFLCNNINLIRLIDLSSFGKILLVLVCGLQKKTVEEKYFCKLYIAQDLYNSYGT